MQDPEDCFLNGCRGWGDGELGGSMGEGCRGRVQSRESDTFSGATVGVAEKQKTFAEDQP